MTPKYSGIAGMVIILAVMSVGPIRSATTSPQRASAEPHTDRAVTIRIKPLPEGVSRILLNRTPDGRRQFELVHLDGTVERLSPEAFAKRLETDRAGKPWTYRILNISSPIGVAWVFLGLLGQVVFTGRLLLQWLVSEKAKRSIVPVGYWWMSLVGASMLLVYFIWRRDIVGVLGLSTGWLIYARNLWLIYIPKSDALDKETGN